MISNIQLDPDKQGGRKPVPEIVRILYENFSPWGEIEDISFDAARFTASIKYSHRFYTEFAKEAMSEQVLVEDVTDPIIMKWQLESDDVDEQLKKQSGNTK